MAVEITEEFVWQSIPPRARDSHKGTFGSVLAVAGSAFYRGAALLVAEGALRTGAGIVTLALHRKMCRCSGGRRPPYCCWAPALAARRKAPPVPPRPVHWCSSFCPVLRGLRCWTRTV